MPLIDVGGVKLHYRREAPEAEGPPLLMLAGMASDSASWQPIIPTLARTYDVIAPDNRCTGATTPNPILTSRDAMLDDLIGLLDVLDIERVHVVGHSMGAMLGWALAARAPERITALIAMCGLPEVTPARIDFFRTMARIRATSDPADWYRLLLHAIFSPAFFNDTARVEGAVIGAVSYAHRQSPEALTAQAEGLQSFLTTPEIENVQCPVLALTGELDVLSTPAMMMERYRNKPEIRTGIIEAAGHAVHWEQPEAVVTHITTFLEQLDSQA